MNSPDPFEDHLARTPLRPPPPGLRARIVRESRPGARAGSRPLGLLREWLWPHPFAWGALALAWAGVVALSFPLFTPGQSGARAEARGSESQAWTVQWREQRALLHSLLEEAAPSSGRSEARPGAKLRRPEEHFILAGALSPPSRQSCTL